MKEITKVKYSQKISKVSVEYFDEQMNKWTAEINVDPHPDFVQTLEALVPHMIRICELNDESAWKYKVTGISMGGDGDHIGAVLIGRKEVLNKKVFNIVTPFVFFDAEISDYEDCGELNLLVNKLLTETNLLLDGKSAQLELDFHDKSDSIQAIAKDFKDAIDKMDAKVEYVRDGQLIGSYDGRR